MIILNILNSSEKIYFQFKRSRAFSRINIYRGINISFVFWKAASVINLALSARNNQPLSNR